LLRRRAPNLKLRPSRKLPQPKRPFAFPPPSPASPLPFFTVFFFLFFFLPLKKDMRRPVSPNMPRCRCSRACLTTPHARLRSLFMANFARGCVVFVCCCCSCSSASLDAAPVTRSATGVGPAPPPPAPWLPGVAVPGVPPCWCWLLLRRLPCGVDRRDPPRLKTDKRPEVRPEKKREEPREEGRLVSASSPASDAPSRRDVPKKRPRTFPRLDLLTLSTAA